MPRGIKRRRRRTKGEIADLKGLIQAVVEDHAPMTVRQVFYQMVTRGAIDKTEAEYKSTICRLLTQMRWAGEIAWGDITDYTRACRRRRSYDGLEQALDDTANLYRRNLWQGLDTRAEVWLEKDALAGVLIEETWDFDVPLMVTRGYPSLSFLQAAAEEIIAAGKPTSIYAFYDYDPSGLHIPKKIESHLNKFAPDARIYFHRVAVNEDQIEAYDLQTRPTKQSDSRAKGFGAESVELDAIPPSALCKLCRSQIENHIPADYLKTHRAAEKSEREFPQNWTAMARAPGSS